MRLLLSSLVVLLLCLFVPACSSSGPKPIKVTGKLLHNEKPYTVAKGGGVGLVFIPIVEPGTPFDTYPTRMNADDSTFTVEGKAGQGIPAGKYRVAIQQMVPGGPAAINEMNERFSDKNSPIIVEVTDDRPVVIDLAKPAGI